MTKAEIYDEQIRPLVDQMVKICEDNDIAVIASFDAPPESDGGLGVFTLIPRKAGIPTFYEEVANMLGLPARTEDVAAGN